MKTGHVDFKKMLSETDFTDPASIEYYAVRLEGMTFRDVLDLGITPKDAVQKDFATRSFKGGMGNLIEERYFGYKSNSDDRPDFPDAGVELKTTCFNTLKNGTKSAGERLVLTMIPYNRAVSTDYEQSHLKSKLDNILLIYYERDRSIEKLDQHIERAVMVHLFEKDMRVIREDYRKITTLIQEGRAHELSEGMTDYLGACTKGATEKTMWALQFYAYTDPVTHTSKRLKAKKRAFSLKRSFMDYVLHNYVLNAPHLEESIVPDDASAPDFETYTVHLLEQYIGKSDREIADILNIPYNGKKAQWTTLVYRMLGIKNNRAEEFIKAGITVRVVRVAANGSIKESMSFSPFKIKELLQEDWDTSTFRNALDSSRFLFVYFRADENGILRLSGLKYWSMPASDIDGAAKACWTQTVKTLKKGLVFKCKHSANGKLTVENNLPKASENLIAHVRPHASQAAYLFGDGTSIGDLERNSDELPDGRRITKQSFWLNSSYLEKILKTRNDKKF